MLEFGWGLVDDFGRFRGEGCVVLFPCAKVTTARAMEVRGAKLIILLSSHEKCRVHVNPIIRPIHSQFTHNPEDFISNFVRTSLKSTASQSCSYSLVKVLSDFTNMSGRGPLCTAGCTNDPCNCGDNCQCGDGCSCKSCACSCETECKSNKEKCNKGHSGCTCDTTCSCRTNFAICLKATALGEAEDGPWSVLVGEVTWHKAPPTRRSSELSHGKGRRLDMSTIAKPQEEAESKMRESEQAP
ncbi:metallothionein [Elysia marginata]|uniref:Metallothionein n=1 Tax=Elysia marginata TaxID=1093978 RepID=A0AAV4ETY4_9GAST|nr:metallothionein [Elysia marginata]